MYWVFSESKGPQDFSKNSVVLAGHFVSFQIRGKNPHRCPFSHFFRIKANPKQISAEMSLMKIATRLVGGWSLVSPNWHFSNANCLVKAEQNKTG